MDNITDTTLLQTIQYMFWQKPFYVIFYLLCLVSLVLFWKSMERGRRFFLSYSLICLIVFIYNPVFINLCEHYLLRGDRVIVRILLLLPFLFTEAYVLTSIVSTISKKNRILSSILAILVVAMLFLFGNKPWQGAKEAGYTYDTPMILLAENPYKIPQEHIDITETIINDMDGERATLSMYEIHGINDVGGTLNYSIRMYTSRIQLREVMSFDSYSSMTDEEQIQYWDEYISSIQDGSTDSSIYYFLFPIGDERAADLLEYGCEVLPVESTNYCLLTYTAEG